MNPPGIYQTWSQKELGNCHAWPGWIVKDAFEKRAPEVPCQVQERVTVESLKECIKATNEL
jgi:hypothetical protein